MIELQNVILTLFHLQAQIHTITQTLNKVFENTEELNKIEFDGYVQHRVNFSDSLNATISNYTIILYCNFLEEYNKFFTVDKIDKKYTDRILNIKKKNKPALKRINKWKDLFDFRNQMVAHNFRIKNQSFFSDDFTKVEYEIPNTNSEKNLIDGIIYLICVNIRTVFPDIIETLNSNYKMIYKLKIKNQTVDAEKVLIELYDKCLITDNNE